MTMEVVVRQHYQEIKSPGIIGMGYECKTCGKSFNSYQALGGHQGIHNKKKQLQMVVYNDNPTIINTSHENYSYYYYNNNKSNVVGGLRHRCKQCLKEFETGQALGGHMRRHRRQHLLNIVDHQKQEKSDNLMMEREEGEVISSRVKDDDQEDYKRRRCELILAAREWRLNII